jgi:3-phenylpropionate/trans-cinnamate dioxygenase ferredoxin reductase subunit
VQPFTPFPYCWSDQYDVKIQVHGHSSDGAEAAIEEGSLADGKFVALYRKDGAPAAVLGWNSPARLARYRKLLFG